MLADSEKAIELPLWDRERKAIIVVAPHPSLVLLRRSFQQIRSDFRSMNRGMRFAIGACERTASSSMVRNEDD